MARKKSPGTPKRPGNLRQAIYDRQKTPAAVFSHPDSHRRYRNLTGSAGKRAPPLPCSQTILPARNFTLPRRPFAGTIVIQGKGKVKGLGKETLARLLADIEIKNISWRSLRFVVHSIMLPHSVRQLVSGLPCPFSLWGYKPQTTLAYYEDFRRGRWPLLGKKTALAFFQTDSRKGT